VSAQSEVVLDRTRRLLTYLAAVSRELTVKPVRDVTQHHDAPVLWPDAVPAHPGIRLGGGSQDRPAWLSVRKVPAPVTPTPPVELAGHLEPDSLGPLATPILQPAPSGRPAELNQELNALLEDWLTQVWRPWQQQAATARAARQLYESLFSLELDTDRLKASHELVWGHSLLCWQVPGQESEQAVRYPLLVTNVVIRMDQTDGTISVVPDGPTELQLNSLEGLALPMMDDLTRVQERVRESPPDPWDSVALAAIHEQLIAPLGLDARVGEQSQLPTPGAEPVLTDTWLLALRPRPTRHDRFYRELAEVLREDSLPPQALAAVVADDDQVRLSRAELGQGDDDGDWHAVGERLLLPLPANAEQERIVRQLARDRGVTVQGPPGTGKSHTIANLVSHLLAHGKRVLVTAQNEQALTVLRDKIPAELRDLSIAVLGSSSDSMEQLRGSAQAVMDIASSVDEDSESHSVLALARDLDELRERLRRVERSVLAALQTEDEEFVLPSGSARAPDVARWLTDQAGDLDRIPDQLDPFAALPLPLQELQELFELSAQLNADDIAALGSHRPKAGDLPSASYLAQTAARLEEFRQDVDDLEAEGLNIAAVDDASQTELDQAVLFAQNSATQVGRLEETWVLQVRSMIAGSVQTSRLWVEQSKLLSDRIRAAMELQRALIGHDVRIPDGDHRSQSALLAEMSQRFAEGKGLPRFGAGELKRLHAEITLNGLALRTPEEITLVRNQMDLGVLTTFLRQTIEQLAQQAPMPVPPPGSGLLREIDVLAQRLAGAVAWQTEKLPEIQRMLPGYVPGISQNPTSQELDRVARLLSAADQRKQERALSADYEALIDILEIGAGSTGASPLWLMLRDAMERKDWQTWTVALTEAARLTGLEGPSSRQGELADRLAVVAPAWAGAIVRQSADPAVVGRPEQVGQLWAWRQAATWLQNLLSSGDLTRLQAEVSRLQAEEQALVLQIARRSAAVGLKRNLKDRNRRALSSWLNALGKLGKGQGKYAPHWQVEARSHLPAAMGAVPVWIMPVHRVIENFDPRVADPFDVVIVDESSQCDLLSVGILALGAKAVVVGDDQQTSPAAVGVNRERIMQLQETYLSDVREKNLLTADESLYSLSERIFPSTILLREHFRCVPEIIDFSNHRYYDGKILPLREPFTAAIGKPLNLIRVAGGVSTGSRSGDRVNRVEAQTLVHQVAACNTDPAYAGMTFGVVTLLGSAQGPLIEGLLRERLGVEVFQRRRLRVGSPAAFQGDERNVIFISVVADDQSWAATKRSDGQRINVAASRAQDQLWVFHTVDPGVLHADDHRRALMEYLRDTDSPADQRSDQPQTPESSFERDVLRELSDHDYEVQVKHRVGRYRIDLVVVGEHGRLAIECDGDRFQGPQQWADDLRRQRQLERLGWTFWRIRASEFYRERARTLAALQQRLAGLEILPRPLWTVPRPIKPAQSPQPAQSLPSTPSPPSTPDELDVDQGTADVPASDQASRAGSARLR
jgi:very-short-patch-repair endonuclease